MNAPAQAGLPAIPLKDPKLFRDRAYVVAEANDGRVATAEPVYLPAETLRLVLRPTGHLAGRPSEITLRPRPVQLVRGRVIELPGRAPIADARCEVRVLGGEVVSRWEPALTAADGTFRMEVPTGPVSIRCHMPGSSYADEQFMIDQSTRAITVRAVRQRPGAIVVGAALRPSARGALIAAVADEAEAAGLRAGDLVVAVDGEPIAGMAAEVVEHLGFRLRRGEVRRWTVRRADTTAELRVAMP